MTWFGGPGPSAVMAAGWTLIGIAAVVVAARLYLRLKIQRTKLVNSDFFMCASLLCAIIASSLTIAMADLGAFGHDVMLSLQGFNGSFHEATLIMKIFWIWGLFFLSALYLSKAALLSVYLKVFPVFVVKRRILLQAIVAFVACAYAASMLTHLLVCLPVDTNWDLTRSSNCLPAKPKIVFKVTWSFHIATDIMIFCLPWLIITNLQMKMSLRMGLYATFLIGLVNIIIAVVRYFAVTSAMEGEDVTFSVLMLFNTVDCNLCLIVASLPSLRPYFSLRSASSSQRARYQKPLDESKASQQPSGTRTKMNSYIASNDRSAHRPTPHHSSANLVRTERGFEVVSPSRSHSPGDIELGELK